MDIVTYVRGDGFPNCEAFVVDPSGKAVFLGVHARKGAAPTTLILNANYPMIASAIRLPIDKNGHFTGTIGDEFTRQSSKQKSLNYQSIEAWNQSFFALNPNRNHCMGLESIERLSECF